MVATSLNVTVTVCGSMVRAFSSVGTRPVTTRYNARPANPKKEQAQRQRAKAADARRLDAIDVHYDAAVGKPGNERWIAGNISLRRDALETFAVALFEGQRVGVE